MSLSVGIVNFDRIRRDPVDDGSTVVSIISSFPPLDLRDLSFFSSIKRCKRSVSMSCSATIDGVDGAPILLFANVKFDESVVVNDGDVAVVIVVDVVGESAEFVGRLLICCSAALISSCVTLCVDRRSRRATAERCFRCASASSSRLGGTFDRRFPPNESSADDDVTVTLVVAVGGDVTEGNDVVTLTNGVDDELVVVVDVDVVVEGGGVGGVSLTPAPERRRTYGTVVLFVVDKPSKGVRSVVPHLRLILLSFVVVVVVVVDVVDIVGGDVGVVELTFVGVSRLEKSN